LDDITRGNDHEDFNLSEIRHEEQNMTNHTTQFDFRNKESRILQDPITPHNKKRNDVLKSQQLNQINNIVNDK